MKLPTAIVRLWLGKVPTCHRTGIAHQFCSTADFWGKVRPSGHPGHAQDKAIRNPAPAAAVIQGWRLNRGQCSNHATEAFPPIFVVTSLSSTVVFAPARQSNFWECPSQRVTVMCVGQQAVFTRTRFALEFWPGKRRNAVGVNRAKGAKPNVCAEIIISFFERFARFARITTDGYHRFKRCLKVFINARPKDAMR